jgi:hypothetical protein
VIRQFSDKSAVDMIGLMRGNPIPVQRNNEGGFSIAAKELAYMFKKLDESEDGDINEFLEKLQRHMADAMMQRREQEAAGEEAEAKLEEKNLRQEAAGEPMDVEDEEIKEEPPSDKQAQKPTDPQLVAIARQLGITVEEIAKIFTPEELTEKYSQILGDLAQQALYWKALRDEPANVLLQARIFLEAERVIQIELAEKPIGDILNNVTKVNVTTGGVTQTVIPYLFSRNGPGDPNAAEYYAIKKITYEQLGIKPYAVVDQNAKARPDFASTDAFVERTDMDFAQAIINYHRIDMAKSETRNSLLYLRRDTTPAAIFQNVLPQKILLTMSKMLTAKLLQEIGSSLIQNFVHTVLTYSPLGLPGVLNPDNESEKILNTVSGLFSDSIALHMAGVAMSWMIDTQIKANSTKLFAPYGLDGDGKVIQTLTAAQANTVGKETVGLMFFALAAYVASIQGGKAMHAENYDLLSAFIESQKKNNPEVPMDVRSNIDSDLYDHEFARKEYLRNARIVKKSVQVIARHKDTDLPLDGDELEAALALPGGLVGVALKAASVAFDWGDEEWNNKKDGWLKDVGGMYNRFTKIDNAADAGSFLVDYVKTTYNRGQAIANDGLHYVWGGLKEDAALEDGYINTGKKAVVPWVTDLSKQYFRDLEDTSPITSRLGIMVTSYLSGRIMSSGQQRDPDEEPDREDGLWPPVVTGFAPPTPHEVSLFSNAMTAGHLEPLEEPAGWDSGTYGDWVPPELPQDRDEYAAEHNAFRVFSGKQSILQPFSKANVNGLSFQMPGNVTTMSYGFRNLLWNQMKQQPNPEGRVDIDQHRVGTYDHRHESHPHRYNEELGYHDKEMNRLPDDLVYGMRTDGSDPDTSGALTLMPLFDHYDTAAEWNTRVFQQLYGSGEVFPPQVENMPVDIPLMFVCSQGTRYTGEQGTIFEPGTNGYDYNFRTFGAIGVPNVGPFAGHSNSIPLWRNHVVPNSNRYDVAAWLFNGNAYSPPGAGYTTDRPMYCTIRSNENPGCGYVCHSRVYEIEDWPEGNGTAVLHGRFIISAINNIYLNQGFPNKDQLGTDGGKEGFYPPWAASEFADSLVTFIGPSAWAINGGLPTTNDWFHTSGTDNLCNGYIKPSQSDWTSGPDINLSPAAKEAGAGGRKVGLINREGGRIGPWSLQNQHNNPWIPHFKAKSKYLAAKWVMAITPAEIDDQGTIYDLSESVQIVNGKVEGLPAFSFSLYQKVYSSVDGEFVEETHRTTDNTPNDAGSWVFDGQQITDVVPDFDFGPYSTSGRKRAIRATVMAFKTAEQPTDYTEEQNVFLQFEWKMTRMQSHNNTVDTQITQTAPILNEIKTNLDSRYPDAVAAPVNVGLPGSQVIELPYAKVAESWRGRNIHVDSEGNRVWYEDPSRNTLTAWADFDAEAAKMSIDTYGHYSDDYGAARNTIVGGNYNNAYFYTMLPLREKTMLPGFHSVLIDIGMAADFPNTMILRTHPYFKWTTRDPTTGQYMTSEVDTVLSITDESSPTAMTDASPVGTIQETFTGYGRTTVYKQFTVLPEVMMIPNYNDANLSVDRADLKFTIMQGYDRYNALTGNVWADTVYGVAPANTEYPINRATGIPVQDVLVQARPLPSLSVTQPQITDKTSVLSAQYQHRFFMYFSADLGDYGIFPAGGATDDPVSRRILDATGAGIARNTQAGALTKTARFMQLPQFHLNQGRNYALVIHQAVERHDEGWGDNNWTKVYFNSETVFHVMLAAAVESGSVGEPSNLVQLSSVSNEHLTDVMWKGCLAGGSIAIPFACKPHTSGGSNDVHYDLMAYYENWDGNVPTTSPLPADYLDNVIFFPFEIVDLGPRVQ